MNDAAGHWRGFPLVEEARLLRERYRVIAAVVGTRNELEAAGSVWDVAAGVHRRGEVARRAPIADIDRAHRRWRRVGVSAGSGLSGGDSRESMPGTGHRE